jgi:elongation factor P
MKASEIKRGHVVEHNGTTWQVRGIERSAPTGRGGNTTFRFQLYSVPGGHKLDLSLRADDELPEVDLLRRLASFSYRDGDNFVFMDVEDYTQYLLGADVVGELASYITDGLEGCYVMLRDGTPLCVELPQQVVLEVIDTAPEMKGATATKRPKPAKLSTGIEIQVPEYIAVGEKVRISTETGEYLGRA